MTSSQISLPGFSAQQVSSLTVLIQHVLDQAFKQHFGPLPPQQKQSVITPKPAQPSEQEQKHKPLQQATAENIAEKIMEKNKSMDSSSPIQEHASALHDPTSDRHSASGERHYNLACYLCMPRQYHISVAHHCNEQTREGSTATITAKLL